MASFEKRRKAIITRDVDDGMLLLDASANLIHQLNETARFVWHYCDGRTSDKEIAVTLVRNYGIDEKIAMMDVIETLGKLKALNLIVEAEAG